MNEYQWAKAYGAIDTCVECGSDDLDKHERIKDGDKDFTVYCYQCMRYVVSTHGYGIPYAEFKEV